MHVLPHVSVIIGGNDEIMWVDDAFNTAHSASLIAGLFAECPGVNGVLGYEVRMEIALIVLPLCDVLVSASYIHAALSLMHAVRAGRV